MMWLPRLPHADGQHDTTSGGNVNFYLKESLIKVSGQCVGCATQIE